MEQANMYLKSALFLFALTALVGCGESSSPTAAAKKKPVELTVAQRLDIERDLKSGAAGDTQKIKNTPECQAYAGKVQAILSVAAEASERSAAIDKTMRDAGAGGCLNK
jgi:hypothetical protein